MGGQGKVVVTGVRWDEGSRRKQSAGTVKIIGKPKKTQKFAEEIGADGYSKDAADAVKVTKALLQMNES